MRKTKKMAQVEAQINEPLEKVLPDLVTELGLSNAADCLDVSKGTVGYWLLKMGLETRRVVVRPGEHVAVLSPEEWRLIQDARGNQT